MGAFLHEVGQLAGRDINLCQIEEISSSRRTGTVDRFPVRRPRWTVVLDIALMWREMLDFAAGHLNGIEILVVIGLHPIGQDPSVIRRPAKGKIIAARAFLKKPRLGEPGWLSARSHFLNINVESALILSIGAEGDLLAVMAPAAERMDRIWLLRQFLLDPTFPQTVVRAAAHSVDAK